MLKKQHGIVTTSASGLLVKVRSGAGNFGRGGGGWQEKTGEMLVTMLLYKTISNNSVPSQAASRRRHSAVHLSFMLLSFLRARGICMAAVLKDATTKIQNEPFKLCVRACCFHFLIANKEFSFYRYFFSMHLLLFLLNLF
jgi:hypothetical protein